MRVPVDPYEDAYEDEWADGDDDLEIDPYLQWEFWTDGLESPPTEFKGDPALVIEPLGPVDGEDALGRPTVNLHFGVVPHVPADTCWLMLLAVDNEYNTWLVANQAVHAPAGDKRGYVRIEDLVPHDSWVLTDDEEMLTFVLLYFGDETEEDDLAVFQEAGTDGSYELDEIVYLIDWTLNQFDAGACMHTLYIEECETLLDSLGWR